MPSLSKVLIAAWAGVVGVSAHGHVIGWVVDGVWYRNFDPTSDPYSSSPPVVAGWTAGDTDNGFVAPDAFGSGDIICHKNATPGGAHIPVKAGSQISIEWNTWPESHHGPVLDYLAPCGTGGCESVDKTKLEFFKIDESGLLDDTAPPGKWASDTLIANNNTWLIEIPTSIAPGAYVLRHEIIALHSAGSVGGAQNYPQCVNLLVTGSGSDSPAGTLGESLYTETDPGIEVNIYASLSYTIPGPKLYSGAATVSQSSVAPTATSSAITGAATGGGAASASSSSTATAAAATKASSAAAATAVAATSKTTSTFANKGAAATGAAGGSSCNKRRHARDVAL